MNTLIIFASVLAVALAAPGYAGLGAYNGLGAYSGLYAGPYAAQAYSGHYAGPYAAQAYAGPYAGPYPYASGLTVAPEGRLIDPVAIAAGAPLPTGDTVEVNAAKAAHFQAHAAATVRNHGVVAYAAHATPLAYAHASPVAYNSGYAYGSPLAYAHAAPLALASEARLIDPVAIAAGAPLPTGDTIEVAAAKAAHFQAHAVARAGHLRYKRGLAYAASPLAYGAHPIAHHAVAYNAPLVSHAYASPIAYAAHPVAHSYAAYAPQSYAYSSQHVSPIAHHAGLYSHY